MILTFHQWLDLITYETQSFQYQRGSLVLATVVCWYGCWCNCTKSLDLGYNSRQDLSTLSFMIMFFLCVVLYSLHYENAFWSTLYVFHSRLFCRLNEKYQLWNWLGIRMSSGCMRLDSTSFFCLGLICLLFWICLLDLIVSTFLVIK